MSNTTNKKIILTTTKKFFTHIQYEVAECTCPSLGVFPDPYSEHHYFVCYPEDDKTMTAIEAECPEGSVFSEGKQGRCWYTCVFAGASDGWAYVCA